MPASPGWSHLKRTKIIYHAKGNSFRTVLFKIGHVPYLLGSPNLRHLISSKRTAIFNLMFSAEGSSGGGSNVSASGNWNAFVGVWKGYSKRGCALRWVQVYYKLLVISLYFTALVWTIGKISATWLRCHKWGWYCNANANCLCKDVEMETFWVLSRNTHIQNGINSYSIYETFSSENII